MVRKLPILGLRKISRSQNESARAKTVFSEREVSKDTSKEEKPFAAEIIESEEGRALRKLSINQSGFIPMILALLAILIAVIIFAYLRVQKAHQ